MFTGIVEEMGTIQKIERGSQSAVMILYLKWMLTSVIIRMTCQGCITNVPLKAMM